ncbi:SDR family NAD(P)-dependent oxidoreductase [Ferrimonas sediminicola]|uniref:SDR family NAD(P)-dependent oxidoreductase n=1 Tax=Ferrimonas sediminicola TaxID=2569538 RepID=A0A4U1BH64_9GAMM|nr:SDR family NAD(P)-dependent oxidoreductase [Ferrimonas sediminicola]TKB50595.1 SDR family NAD(P)-dependent oxidoreductase [Ferrimonas sediminicola]
MRVLITGATSGIGRQLALDYRAEGHEVFGCGRNPAALQELADAGIHPLAFDAGERRQVLESLAELASLDLVILNAGSCEYIDHPRQFDGALLQRVMQTNVIGVGYCLEALLPRLAPGSRLALMGSIASELPLPRAEAYGASKAAVAYLARTLALDLRPHGIGVSLIRPGFVRTPLTDKNDFAMPMRVEATEASRVIRRELARGVAEIHFPKRFTRLLKLLGKLPDRAWQRIALKGLKR